MVLVKDKVSSAAIPELPQIEGRYLHLVRKKSICLADLKWGKDYFEGSRTFEGISIIITFIVSGIHTQANDSNHIVLIKLFFSIIND